MRAIILEPEAPAGGVICVMLNEGVSSAQEAFRVMLRDEIAPALRELGFVGSGQIYRLPDDRHWARLGFQKSAFSMWEQVSFTINLSVVSKELWEQRRSAGRLPARPAPSTFYGPWMWQRRRCPDHVPQ
ncbi:DUF4304 domain-containing protein [Thermoactinospora rubra]|uniref:DUF4304 domain-containing protein n=1 Tax=Thermoactinospora rubra TaxID=1088767 RepID=UPI000A11F2E4|nr:DUF4304 domain-containing protein [Thermoactinospora rubra]